MALKVYKKRPVKIKQRRITEKVQKKSKKIVLEEENPPLTLWDVGTGIKNDFTHLLQTSTLARVLIPSILIISGSFLLYSQIYPEAKQRARQATGYYNPTKAELVKGDSIQPKETYLSNPGSDYFRKLTQEAEDTHVLASDPVSEQYQGQFSLSIPSLELNNLPVQANVESGVEEVYDQVLNTSLAHFQGTGLPISDVNNNIVIYGHSATNNYFSRTNDVAAAFSKLSEVKIGDEVSIQMDGKEYKFRIVKTKIVKPDDISIITGTKNKETLTLFTCYPSGINSNRFVAVARPI